MESPDLSDLIGIPYSTMKCYDLAMEVYRRIGKELPDFRNNATLLKNGLGLIKIEKPEKWCIMLLAEGSRINHIGIYLGHGKMIHTNSLVGVLIEDTKRLERKIKGYYKTSDKPV